MICPAFSSWAQLFLAPRRWITIRCKRNRGPRGFFCLQDFRRGLVNVAVIGLNRANGASKMKTENPYQPPDSVGDPPHGRISIVSTFWLIVFLLILVFFAFEFSRQVFFGNAAIAVNLCVFCFPILIFLGWNLQKRISRELSLEHKSKM